MFNVSAVSPKFWAPVKAEMQAEPGGRVRVEFDVQFKRLTIPEVQSLSKRAQDSDDDVDNSTANTVDYLMEITTDWKGLGDGDNNPLPFTRENMQTLANLGLGAAIIAAFRDALPKARIKN